MGRAGAPVKERYTVAVLLSLGAAVVTMLIPHEHLGVRVVVSIGAVALSALRGGTGPGVTTVVLCAAAFALQTDVAPSSWWAEPNTTYRWLFFVGAALLTVWAGAALRDGYRQARARRRRAEASAQTHRIAAELGIRALEESDLPALIEDTLEAAKRALRCDSVTLLELTPGGESLRLRDVAGVGRELVGSSLGPAEAPLGFRVLAAREAIAVDDIRKERELASPVLLRNAVISTLAAPIVAPGHAGRPFGVINAHWGSPRVITPEEGAFLQTAANVLGIAVVRITADERARRALVTERFLAGASQQLALSIDWQETVGRVALLALPFLGDWCLVVFADPPGRPRAVVAEASDPSRKAAVQELLARYPVDLGAEHGVGRVLRTGEPELLPEVTPEGFVRERNGGAQVRLEVLVRLGMCSYLGVPLRVGDRVLGALAFGISEGPRRYGREDLEVAEELAQRCALALENASLYRSAQEATRAREQVMAVVSHDLKTPLAALMMGAQLIEKLAPASSGGRELRRATGSVLRTAERVRRLVHDLVDLSSIDTGGLSVHPVPNDAAAIAAEAVDGLRGRALDRGITLELEVSVPPPVHCDRDRVLQVLENLVANAIQVSEGGGRVAVSVWSTGEEIVFRVLDHGPGVPSEDRPHIFERWFRGRARYPGSGLGLAIAKTIVTAHGGSIWVESQEGEGAVFSFALPRSFEPALSDAG
jgi:signal transduction histidine kinase